MDLFLALMIGHPHVRNFGNALILQEIYFHNVTELARSSKWKVGSFLYKLNVWRVVSLMLMLYHCMWRRSQSTQTSRRRNWFGGNVVSTRSTQRFFCRRPEAIAIQCSHKSGSRKSGWQHHDSLGEREREGWRWLSYRVLWEDFLIIVLCVVLMWGQLKRGFWDLTRLCQLFHPPSNLMTHHINQVAVPQYLVATVWASYHN